MKRLWTLALAVPLSAQTITPDITPDLKAKFWRAQFEEAQARSALTAVVSEMKDVCAEKKKVLNLDQKGEPVCVEPSKSK